MTYEITPELESLIFEKYSANISPSEIKKEIEKALGCKKTKANEIYNEVTAKFEDASSDIFDFELEAEDPAKKPYFNKTTGKYVVFINCLGRNIVVSESKHKQILEMYSDWDGEAKTLTEICRAIQWPRQVLTAYLKAFQITHESLPLTDEELAEYDDEELASRLRELRKFNIYQKLEKEGWDETRADAAKWKSYKNKLINPFQEIIKNWTPPKMDRAPLLNRIGDKSLLVGCCDWHLGAFADKDTTFRNLDLNTNKVAGRIIDYSKRVIKDAENQDLKEICILWAGDILHSSGSAGTTNKGTLLESDNKGGKLFKIALDVLAIFVQNILSLGLPVRCFSVSGNHDSALNTGLLYAIEALFKKDNIKFDISNRFIEKFVINNSIICGSHGAHPDIKAKLPRGNKIQNYAQSLFLEAQNSGGDYNSRYLFTADLHHQAIQEYNDFMYILMPSITGGDGYSDALNLNSRACQQTFLFDSEGIKSINNYYF